MAAGIGAVQQQHLDQGVGAGPVAVRAFAAVQNRSWVAVNTPASRAWTSAVAPGSAPGLWASTSR